MQHKPPLMEKFTVCVFLVLRSKGSRSMLVGQVFLLETWGTKAQQPHIFRKAALVLEKCGFLALVPQAFKKTLGSENYSGSHSWAFPLETGGWILSSRSQKTNMRNFQSPTRRGSIRKVRIHRSTLTMTEVDDEAKRDFNNAERFEQSWR